MYGSHLRIVVSSVVVVHASDWENIVKANEAEVSSLEMWNQQAKCDSAVEVLWL